MAVDEGFSAYKIPAGSEGHAGNPRDRRVNDVSPLAKRMQYAT